KMDIVFIGAFTEAAHLAYALSRLIRSRGAVTVLGGPHARCYPADAQQYFDYVLGFTDQETIRDVLDDCSRHQPVGVHLSAKRQPSTLPGVRERWKYIEATLRKAPWFKIVPMIGSLGCPYTCSFCIDAAVPYQPLGYDVMREDLRFLLTKFKRPHVGWHDPNFGIQFDACMDAIESAVPPDRIDFIAESTLSILSEPHVRRMKKNGFKALLPGIESWYDLGNKSKMGHTTGMEKVERVSQQVNMILRYVPYVQANFVLGLDTDEGPEPFELTKKFLDRTPGALPAFSLLTSFGQAAVLNLDYQREGRVLPFPFHFLNNNHAMNVQVKNYGWTEFYDRVIDLTRHASTAKAIGRRLYANGLGIPGWLNVARGMSSEFPGRVRYYSEVRRLLDHERPFRRYFEQETTELPLFFRNRLRTEMGHFWDWAPKGSVQHDPYAYLKAERELTKPPPSGPQATSGAVAVSAGGNGGALATH
ncbi:MAG: radical SAM protein, partial [candidate division Zixibacteria bacterium]|nr:radical SAM protein [candidate division Zixibacteria bacterium]